ncbi:hypothetical protein PPACK8108_LOCUS21842 [Phakopsora pachyrhizi]|uniref:Uncharacterized protein n=1 Tax=Phakopsora pachyrhizi TaxID=170000 RepID=A0AAV0BLU6_PHAPC|nr:hypothetical protein PPACK8108_LOCUS21842 [Phakopsora pachyrhizi]
MNSHLPYSPTTEDPIGIGPPPSLHSSLSPTLSTGHTSASGDWIPGHNEFTEKEISKGPMVRCNLDLKAFGYDHPLVKAPTPPYPSDGSSIGEFLTSLVPIYFRDHLLTFDIVAYNGRRSVMRCVGIPTGGVAIGPNAWTNHEGVVVDLPTGSQPKRQIASLPDKSVSEDSVSRGHGSKSSGFGQPTPLPGCGTSADAEGDTNPNYDLELSQVAEIPNWDLVSEPNFQATTASGALIWSRVKTTTTPPGSYSIKGKERHLKTLFKYQDFEESLDGNKIKERQTPLQDYEDIEADEDKVLILKSGLKYEGILKSCHIKDFDAAQDWPWSQGFDLTVNSSKPNRNVYLKCSQGAVNLSKGRSAKRTSTSRRTGCKYEVSGRLTFSVLSTHRRFDQKELEMIHNLSAAADTGAFLKDVYNAKTKLVRAQRSGRTPLEHLHYEVIWSNYLYDSKKDSNNNLTHLFFAHPESIRLAQIYHHVDDLFDLVNRKISVPRRTSIAGSTIDKRIMSQTSYETVTQGSPIKLRTDHEELMRYITQPLQRLVEKIDNPPKDGDYRNIEEDIKNTQAQKSAGLARWLKKPIFGYAIANHLKRPL